MEDLAGNALAGLIAALTATAILGCAKRIHSAHLILGEKKFIRDVIADGRKRVMASKDTPHRGMETTLPGDVLRAAQYNLMIKQLEVALNHARSRIPYDIRKQLYEALDWFGTQSLFATKNQNGNPVFVDLPAGMWPHYEMQESQAAEKFDRLASIKWLECTPENDL